MKKKISDKEAIKMKALSVRTGTMTPVSRVSLNVQGQMKKGKGTGVGPVDASTKAIMNALGEQYHLATYKLKAISGGTDNLCQVEVIIEDEEGNMSTGSTTGTDIVKTSVDAILEGINQLYKP